MVKELEQSDSGHVFIEECTGEHVNTCIGHLIKLQTPQITDDPITGTYYKEDPYGEIKWGADGILNEEVVYLVPHSNFSSANAGRLMRLIATNHCGIKGCEPEIGEDCNTCELDCGECDPCFLAGTPILLADGSTKDIEAIKVGDTVLAYDQESGKNKSDKVVETFIHEEDNYLLINGRIKATPNHPVFHKGRWVDIGLLNIGDELTKVNGSKETITSIERIEEPVLVYNLEVNPYHTYYADNILAHNKGCLLPGTSILMADGTNKFIENIVTGDKVTSYSENSRTKLGDTVKEVFMHEVQGYLIINDGIKVTTEHPFFANGAWVRAGKLKQGDILLTQEGKEETITSIEAVDEKIIVYNIEVNPYHNYFANGYLVHNKDLPAQGRDPGGCPPFCAIKKFFSNLVFAEDMGSIDNYTFSVVADNIIRVDFQGFDESGNPKDSNPDSVNIIIEASKDSMMSGPFEFSITSSVTLRN